MKQTLTFPVALGDEVRDRVTGFTGIVTGLTEWFNKCQRAIVQPPVGSDGRMPGTEAFDVEQLDVITSQKIAQRTQPESGGPMPAVTREPTPRNR